MRRLKSTASGNDARCKLIVIGTIIVLLPALAFRLDVAGAPTTGRKLLSSR
jgi:hypothetical protein